MAAAGHTKPEKDPPKFSLMSPNARAERAHRLASQEAKLKVHLRITWKAIYNTQDCGSLGQGIFRDGSLRCPPDEEQMRTQLPHLACGETERRRGNELYLEHTEVKKELG